MRSCQDKNNTYIIEFDTRYVGLLEEVEKSQQVFNLPSFNFNISLFLQEA